MNSRCWKTSRVLHIHPTPACKDHIHITLHRFTIFTHLRQIYNIHTNKRLLSSFYPTPVDIHLVPFQKEVSDQESFFTQCGRMACAYTVHKPWFVTYSWDVDDFAPDKPAVRTNWSETVSGKSLKIPECSPATDPAKQEDAWTVHWLIKNIRQEFWQAGTKTHPHRVHNTRV